MTEFGIDNILDQDQIETLFSEGADEIEIGGTSEPEEGEENKNENKEEITEVDVDNLFDGEDEPESVGSEKNENIEKKENTSENEDEGSSPDNFYSSITKALIEDGILQNLDDESLNGIKDSNGLREAIKNQIDNQLTDVQKRVNDALNAGMEISDIKKYENTINYLDNISDKDITAENSNGIELRKQLIWQDLINRGYSQQRAERELKKSFDQGTDIDDAKEALTSNKEYFKSQYDSIIEDSKEAERLRNEAYAKQAEDFRKDVMAYDTAFGGIKINEATRRKIYDNVTNPIYFDEDGNKITALQKYQSENKGEFLKIVSTLYTITDGFKDFSILSKNAVREERKRGLDNLEKVINNTSRTPNGNIRFISSTNDDDSYIGNFDIDI